jgi:hyaluronan synthase
VPCADFRPGRPLAWAAGSLAVAGFLLARHGAYVWSHAAWRPLMASWLAGAVLVAVQWLLALRDRPAAASDRLLLGRLHVTVNVPVFNEAPPILDRCLWALVNQTRPPDHVHVVDDGSAVSYSQLRGHWAGRHGRTLVTWDRYPNAGKKAAQAATFTSTPAADIYVTVDSDSALEHRAIERGLAPFTDPRVQSVAGVVLVDNQRVNWITRTTNSRTLLFQVVACGAQSALGGILVNRGPLAFYRAPMIRDIVPAYLDETFFGRRIKLGDDAALTLFAQGRGRTVQQSDSFAFSAYPETVSHHLRQWTRWMRGSTIRNCWRVRYLPAWSYGWWFTVVNLYLFLISCALPPAVAATWPRSEGVALWILAALVPWAYLTGLRILTVRRSDETAWDRLMSLAIYPGAVLWGLLVLRWLRFLGIATWWRQEWNTRQDGAENLTAPDRQQVAA